MEKRIYGKMPDPLASNAEKISPEYGLATAIAIQDEWFAGGMIDNKTFFFGRNQEIHKNRLYYRGEQDVELHKQFVERQKGDLSYMNLNWVPINIAEKFCNIVINGLSDENYRFEVKSVDRFAALERKNKIYDIKNQMALKPVMEKVKQYFNVDLTPSSPLPEDEEEINFWVEVKDRPKVEIAEEILVNYVKKTNEWDFIKQQIDKDLVINGIAVARVYTDNMNGVQLQYVDPEAYGHSYVEKNNFSDAYYHFFVDTITLSDLRRENPDLSDDECRKIAKLYSAQNKKTEWNYDTQPIHTFLDFRIHIMRYCYKTIKEIVYKKYHDKKNRVKKVAKRDSDYSVPEGAENSKISKRIDTWYEGNYVVGSNKYVWGWKECEWNAKDEMNKVMSPFVVVATNIYKNKLKSFLNNIEPFTEQMQYIHLKIQHLMAELKPDIIELDLDMLADLNTDTKGESKSKTWELALNLLNTKGVVIKKRLDMGEEGMKEGTAVKPTPTRQGTALTELLNLWAHYYNALREVTGINPAKDGTVNPNSLVGVNQMMILASNTATKHIAQAAIDFDLAVCKTISARIKDVFKFEEGKAIAKKYKSAVGKESVDLLTSLDGRHKHEFGFFAELTPSQEELTELRTDLSMALQEGTIDISDKAEILRIAKTSFKQAEEYMRFIRKRRIKERQKEQEMMQQLQTESNIAAAEQAAQSKVEAYGLQKQIDLDYEAKLSEVRLMERQAQHQIDAPKDDVEFQRDVYKEQVKAATTMNLARYKEDAKDLRLKDQSTHQSKLINQRQNQTPPVDFKEMEQPTFLDEMQIQ